MSQKYRQRGYRDDEREEREPRSPSSSGPKDPTLRPRGRGLGKPTATVFRCAVCGHQQSAEIEVESTCAKCGRDLHSCTHCTFFDASAPHQCREKVTQPVFSKAKGNRCELFQAKATQEFAKESGGSNKSARDAFDALFK